jgi:hypothetical protein
MQLIILEFQEILHIHRNGATRGSPEHTIFSFMSDFKYTPYVKIPGFPRLENGMTVAALLREKDDWKTLVGWRDLATNQIAGPNSGYYLMRLIFSLVFITGISWLLLGAGFPIGTPKIYLMMPLLLIGYLTYAEYKLWNMVVSDIKALREIQLTK